MDELTISHELTIFRDYRSDTPGPSAAQTEAARARLLDAIAAQRHAAPRLRSSRHWGWPGPFGRTRVWAPVAAAAAITAIAITVALLAAPGHGPTPKPKPSPAATHQSPQIRHQKSSSSHRAHGTSDAGASQGPAGRTTAGSGAPGSPGVSAGGAPGSPPAGSGASTPTMISIGYTPVPGVNEQQLKLTADVTDHTGDNLTGGTISFYVATQPTGTQTAPTGMRPICVQAPLTYNSGVNNVATCYYTPTRGETEETDTFVAGYSGSGQYRASESASVTLNVPSLSDPVVSLTATVSGQTLTMTATVTDQADDNLSGGAVTFIVTPNAQVGELGAACPAPLTYDATTGVNIATCSYTLPAPGSYTLLATFTGYQQHPKSYSNYLVVTSGS